MFFYYFTIQFSNNCAMREMEKFYAINDGEYAKTANNPADRMADTKKMTTQLPHTFAS